MYLFKITGSQELGWKAGSAGARGPYLLVAKRWSEHFPSLSTTVLNDSAPLSLRFATMVSVVPYVWHNAKYLDDVREARGITRGHDERRIYIASLKTNGIALPEPGDIVGFRPVQGASLNDVFDVITIRRDTALHAALLATKQSLDNYWILRDDAALQAGLRPPSRECRDMGSTAAASGTSSALIKAGAHGIGAVIQSRSEGGSPVVAGSAADVADTPVPAIGNEVFERLSVSEDEALSRRTSDEVFRYLVLNAYKMRCAFTGRAIHLGGGFVNLEAAHIKPRSHLGLNLTCNGIALCRDLHWALDKGAFTLTSDFRAEVHPDVRDEFLRSIHGKQALLPTAPYNLPRFEFMEHHRRKVFGRFKISGSLRSEP